MAQVPDFLRQQAEQNWNDAAKAGFDSYDRLLDGVQRSGQGGRRPILLLDGGLGTTLEDEYGIAFSSTESPAWSSHLLATSPETLSQLHRSFAMAGADIISTATYQASLEGFSTTRRSHGGIFGSAHAAYYSQTEAKALMRSAIPLARSAFGSRKGLVALSLGPYGATMIPSTEYTGEYPPEMESGPDLYRWYIQRMLVFEGDAKVWADIDIVAFETVPCLNEITAVRSVMQILSGHKPYWISCVFPSDEDKLPDGSGVIDVVGAMLRQQAFRPDFINYIPVPTAIGINCTKVQKLPQLVKSFEDAAASLHMTLPHLVLYPNGTNNANYDSSSQKWVPQEGAAGGRNWDDEFFNVLEEVRKRDKWAGIIVGGCCKTTPQDIAKLRKRIDQII